MRPSAIHVGAAVGAALIPILALLWASGAPLFLGIRIWTEQLLIASVALAMGLCFLKRSFARRAREAEDAPWYDRIAALFAFAYGIYLVWRFPYLTENLFYAQDEALIVASIGLVLLLETVRRAIGWPLIAILGAICLYALFADHLTGPLQSRAVKPERLVIFAILDSASMVGAALTIAVVVVVPYVVLARLLMASGGSSFFSDLSVSLLGGTRGGAGKIAVLGSAFFGSISGSAVSNVASTGAITIPLMTKAGYRPKTAAAIEASSSTGGQLVPPIMGASAFLLAENLRVPYSEVVAAALIPAILYYVSLLAFADFEAARRDLKPIEGDRPSVWSVLRRGWFVLMPFFLLIIGLFAFNLRPETAALVALGALFVIALFKTYEGPRISGRDLIQTLVDAGKIALDIILICAVASIVIGVFNLSGLSFGLTFFLVQVGQGSLLLLLGLTAVLCIILGMGLPTVGVYLLLAALAAPPLIELGIQPMAAHLFVLYFGMLSMITPPVAIAAFVAANMARAPAMMTAVEAVRVGWTAFLVPMLFVGSPALLMMGAGPFDSLLAMATATAGICLVTAGVVGWFRVLLTPVTRILCVAVGLALFVPHSMIEFGPALNIAGAIGGALIWVFAARLGTAAAPAAKRI
ncbi:MAG: TRAP transporter fused permease subunit [Roseibium sp.]|nr:TRAP transporter fused permease subunit [Roseibium sp.]